MKRAGRCRTGTSTPGFAALLILLAVVDEGLGAVFFGIRPAIMADFRMRFRVPAEWTPIGVIAIGYPDPGADRAPWPVTSMVEDH
jgi:nitroreductase